MATFLNMIIELDYAEVGKNISVMGLRDIMLSLLFRKLRRSVRVIFGWSSFDAE